jgi:hypothetical protein
MNTRADPLRFSVGELAALTLKETQSLPHYCKIEITSSEVEIIAAFNTLQPHHVALLFSSYVGADNRGRIPANVLVEALLSDVWIIRNLGCRGLSRVSNITDRLYMVIWDLAKTTTNKELNAAITCGLLEAIRRRDGDYSRAGDQPTEVHSDA